MRVHFSAHGTLPGSMTICAIDTLVFFFFFFFFFFLIDLFGKRPLFGVFFSFSFVFLTLHFLALFFVLPVMFACLFVYVYIACICKHVLKWYHELRFDYVGLYKKSRHLCVFAMSVSILLIHPIGTDVFFKDSAYMLHRGVTFISISCKGKNSC